MEAIESSERRPRFPDALDASLLDCVSEGVCAQYQRSYACDIRNNSPQGGVVQSRILIYHLIAALTAALSSGFAAVTTVETGATPVRRFIPAQAVGAGIEGHERG